MQIQLEDNPDYKSKYEDNPIETLEEIKTLMQYPQERNDLCSAW